MNKNLDLSRYSVARCPVVSIDDKTRTVICHTPGFEPEDHPIKIEIPFHVCDFTKLEVGEKLDVHYRTQYHTELLKNGKKKLIKRTRHGVHAVKAGV